MKLSILGTLGSVIGGIGLAVISWQVIGYIVTHGFDGHGGHIFFTFAALSLILMVSAIYDNHAPWLRIVLAMPTLVLAWGVLARIIL